MSLLIENYEPYIQANGGLSTNKPVVLGSSLTVTGTTTFTGSLIRTFNTVAVNATATLTAAQVTSSYITSTSAAPVTMTLPTGTLLGAQVGAVQGTVMELFIDNTAGANTVTIAVATNGIKSDAANTTAASFGQLTVASGATGVGRFSIMFSSPTAYVFTRTA